MLYHLTLLGYITIFASSTHASPAVNLPPANNTKVSPIRIPPSFAEVVGAGLSHLTKLGIFDPENRIVWIKAKPTPSEYAEEQQQDRTDFTTMTILVDQPEQASYVQTQNTPEQPLIFRESTSIPYTQVPDMKVYRAPFRFADIQHKTVEAASVEADHVTHTLFDELLVEWCEHNFFWTCYSAPVIYRFRKDFFFPDSYEVIVGTSCGGAKKLLGSSLSVNRTLGVNGTLVDTEITS